MEIVERENALCFTSDTGDIVRCYQDMVYRIAFTYCKNAADAEDVAQEVFIRYLNSKKEFDDEEYLKAWLIRVTVNASKNLLRSSWFKKTVSISKQENLRAEEGEKTETYYAVMSLPEKYRSVILLYYFEEYTVREIADILQRSETAVQTQLQRARAILKQKLKGDWQNE